MKRFLLAVVVVCLASTWASAWSAKEHIMITRTAVRNLLESPTTPEDMKAWLREAQPGLGDVATEREFLINTRIGIYPRGVDGLAYWAVMPDLISDSASGKRDKVEPFGVTEGLLHYIDLEYFMPQDSRRSYAPDLSNKPTPADVPQDMKDKRYEKAGMLPFRIEQTHGEMVKAIKARRLTDKPGQLPRDEHATKWAGYVAHYAADNWMPYHATADYQGYSYFPEFEKKPRVHFDMEFRMTDGEDADYPELRTKLWEAYARNVGAIQHQAIDENIWTTSLMNSMAAYDSIPTIGQAARVAYVDAKGELKDFDADAFFGHEGQYEGKKMSVLEIKALSMARATRWVEALWLNAWKQAAQVQ